MKRRLQNLWLLTLLVVLGGVSAWAYTPALTADYKVAGYKAKAYYNIANENTGSMCPAEGDLRYRGAGYGLFNYGSGNRGADVTISVAAGDLLLAEFKDTQNRSVTINSISGCTKNANHTNGDIIAFDVTSDATSLNVNIGRGGCIIAFAVLEKDASVPTAAYTINYLLNGEGEPVKTVSSEGAVGSKVATESSFYTDFSKYFRIDGQPDSITIANENNTFNINVREAFSYVFNVKSNLGATLVNGKGDEGENLRVGYPRYQLVDGKFYEAGVDNKEYRKTVSLTKDSVSVTVNYAEKENVKAVFYTEGEDLENIALVTSNNIPARASNALAAFSTGDVFITKLPAAKYKFHAGIFTSKSQFADQSVNFAIGDTLFKAVFANVNLNEIASEEYVLKDSSDVKYLGTTSWGDAQLDYIWIEKTGDVAADTISTDTTAIEEPVVVDTIATEIYDFKNNNFGHEWATGLSDAGNVAGDTLKGDYSYITNVNGNTATRFFTNASKGNHLQVYKGATLLMHAAEGKSIIKIEIKSNGGKATKLSAQAGNGTQTGNVWEGNATVVKFDAASTDYLDSLVVTIGKDSVFTFTPAALEYTEVANIAEFNKLEAGTLAKLNLKDARVNGYYDSFHTYYVEDSTAATEFTQLPVSLKGGDVLNGFVYVKKDYDAMNYDHKARQAEDFSKNDFSVKAGQLKGTAAEVKTVGDSANVGKLFTISDVDIKMIGRFFYAFANDSDSIQVKDELAVLPLGYYLAGKKKSLTGIVIFNGARWEIMPISAVTIIPEVDLTFDFTTDSLRGYVGTAMADVKGFIYNETYTVDGAQLQITAGSAPSRIYTDKNRGNCLVMYKEYSTLTFTAPAGKAIGRIDFTAAGNSSINFTATSGTIEGMSWIGNAECVRFQNNATPYLANAQVSLVDLNSMTMLPPTIEYSECANIAAFNELENGTYAKVTLTDAEVIGKSADGSTVFIQDATSGCWIQYTSLNDSLKESTKVNGSVYVVKRFANNNPQMKEAEGTPKSELNATAINEYTIATGDSLKQINVAANLNKVVKIVADSLKMTSSTAGTMYVGQESIAVNNGAATANQQLHKIADWKKDSVLVNVEVTAILTAKSATENQLLPISIVKDETTGIRNFHAADKNVVIYNLQGVRQDRAKKGLNIINGKKVVLK